MEGGAGISYVTTTRVSEVLVQFTRTVLSRPGLQSAVRSINIRLGGEPKLLDDRNGVLSSDTR